MSPKRRLLSYILFVAGIVLLIGAAAYYLHIQQPAIENSRRDVPEELADLPLVQVVTGQEAVDSIHQLHGSDFPLKNGTIAVYRNQNITLWIAEARSVSGAKDLTELMNERIAEGDSPFIALGELNLDGYTIYALDGLGQAHYYWQSGNLVLWLAADVSVAQHAIVESVEFYR